MKKVDFDVNINEGGEGYGIYKAACSGSPRRLLGNDSRAFVSGIVTTIYPI